MDFDLKELAATLAIGAFLIFGIEFIVFSVFKENVFSEVIPRLKTHPYVVIAFTATLCFIFGMVAEDVSNKFVDDDIWLTKIKVLKSDNSIKTSVLFGDLNEIEPVGLVAVSSKYRLLGKYGADGVQVENYVLDHICDPNDNEYIVTNAGYPTKDQIDTVAKRFYYEAKNFVYQNEFYYDDLKRIQRRIDFSRSLVAVVLFFFALGLGSVIIKSITLWVQKFNSKGQKGDRDKNTKHEGNKTNNELIKIQKGDLIKDWRVRLSLICLILLSLFFLARFAYSSEEEEFDKRTYGYYLSLKMNLTPTPIARCKEKSSASKKQ